MYGKSDMAVLKPWVSLFLETYLANGNRAGAAMRIAKPYLKVNSSDCMASKLLKSRQIQDELARLQMGRESAVISNRDYIKMSISRLSQKAEESSDFGNAIKGQEAIAKLSNLYDTSESDNAKFNKFIQALGSAKGQKVIKPISYISDESIHHDSDKE